MDFTIDEAYFTSVTNRIRYSTVKDPDNPTEEDTINVLCGRGHIDITSSQDHPEFLKLREELGEGGFIKIERGWWNGDYVTKPFTLNGAKFIEGEQFPCATAIKYTIKYKAKQ